MSPESIKRKPWLNINADILIPQIIAGNLDSLGILDSVLRPKLMSFFQHRNTLEAEDLADIAFIAIVQGLPSFTSSGKGDYNRSFSNWCYSISRYILVHSYRDKARRGEIRLTHENIPLHQPEPLPSEIAIEGFKRAFNDKLEEILTPEQLRVVRMKMEGHTPDQIRRELGLSKKYSDVMGEARARYEQQLIFPAGFAHISNHALLEAARRGSLEAAHLLGRFYTKDEWIQRYVPRKRKLSRANAPSEQHVRLSELQTDLGYRDLLSAVQAGALKAIKGGHYWFVTEGDFEIFLEQIRENEEETYPHPFVEILFKTAKAKGYDTVLKMAGVFGLSSETIRKWRILRSVPNRESLEGIMKALHLNEEEQARFTAEWDTFPERRKRGH